jgi:hypothetical protein
MVETLQWKSENVLSFKRAAGVQNRLKLRRTLLREEKKIFWGGGAE